MDCDFLGLSDWHVACRLDGFPLRSPYHGAFRVGLGDGADGVVAPVDHCKIRHNKSVAPTAGAVEFILVSECRSAQAVAHLNRSASRVLL